MNCLNSIFISFIAVTCLILYLYVGIDAVIGIGIGNATEIDQSQIAKLSNAKQINYM